MVAYSGIDSNSILNWSLVSVSTLGVITAIGLYTQGIIVMDSLCSRLSDA